MYKNMNQEKKSIENSNVDPSLCRHMASQSHGELN